MDAKEDFDDSPSGWHKRWVQELDAAKKRLEAWHKSADAIVNRFLDEREGEKQGEKRLNLFTSNVQTQRALMYGQTPKVTVGRRFADANDDVARVAGEMLGRLLNTDIERDSDSYADAVRDALSDFQLAGMGNARVRYVARFEDGQPTPAKLDPATGAVLAPEVPPVLRKVFEDVETDYVHWRDQRWSQAKTFGEVTWWGFLARMSRSELVKRFGEELGRAVPLKTPGKLDGDPQNDSPWSRAEVWEVWDKETRQVFWLCENYPAILDKKPDPYELEGFWPFPRPMFANVTTSKLVPRPDFAIAQDAYNEVDRLTTRIDLLTKAVRVAGTYDKGSPEVKRLLNEAGFNELIPSENFAALSEKGGLKGVVDWFPLEMIVAALQVLREQRREAIDLLFQVTGMSDIMRGQGSGSGITATEQGIKAKFGSVRMQACQDELARFASGLQKLRAELIASKFDPQTILQRCNCEHGFDLQLVPQAVELIRSRLSSYRIEVKPENVSLTDFAQVKQERTEVIAAVGGYFQAAAPLVQQMPSASVPLLRILQWMVSGLRGASQIEGVLDQAIASAEQAAKQPKPPPPPDPKLQAVQAKGALDLQKVQAELRADIVRAHVEAQSEDAKQRSQTEWNLREAREKEALKPVQPQNGVRPGGGPL